MSKSVLTLTILTLITLILWVVFTLIRIFNNPQLPANYEANLKPIDSTFDTEYLNKVYKLKSQ